MNSDGLRALVDERFARAGALLHDAIRVDFARFVARQIEERLRARPHFCERMTPEDLVVLRAACDASLDPLLDAAGSLVNGLRARAAELSDERTAADALAQALSQLVVEETRGILEAHRFPSDREADPGAAAAPADYAIGYIPSPQVLWAWRTLCDLDQLSDQLTDGETLAPSFLVRIHLPEAL